MTRTIWTVLTALLLSAGIGLSQPVQADDSNVLIEFNRYSLKMLNRDPTPLIRIYESGRTQVYYSAYSPRAGIYEYQLTEQTVDALVDLVVATQLDQLDSLSLAASAEAAEIARESAGEYYYTSDHTVSDLRLYLPGARAAPLMIENLQDTDSRFSNLPAINGFAEFERKMLALAARTDGRRIGNPTSLEALR